MTDIFRIVEGTFRSLNNLLERFHQSFFFYILCSGSRWEQINWKVWLILLQLREYWSVHACPRPAGWRISSHCCGGLDESSQVWHSTIGAVLQLTNLPTQPGGGNKGAAESPSSVSKEAWQGANISVSSNIEIPTPGGACALGCPLPGSARPFSASSCS